MKNTMDDLRNHLFATIEGLLDPDKPMSVEQSRAVNQTAQTLINSAKVEVQYLEATGQEAGGTFFTWKHTSAPRLTAGNPTTHRPVAQLLARNGRGSKP